MNRKSIILYTCLALLFVTIPSFINTLKLESSDKAVICSIKVTDNYNEIRNILLNKKPLKNANTIVFDDSFFIDNISSIKELSSNGYRLALSVSMSKKSPAFFESLRMEIENKNINTILIEQKDSEFDYNTCNMIIDIAQKNGIMIGLIENSQQNGLQNPELIEFSRQLHNISNRSLVLYEKDIYELSEKDLSYRLLRSIIDRGIRFIVLEANNSDSLTYSDNVFGNLNKELKTKGYFLQSKISTVSSQNKESLGFVIVGIFSLLTIIKILELFQLSKKHALKIIVIYLAVLLSMYIFNYEYTMILLAFIISNTVPASVSIYLYKYVKNRKFSPINIYVIYKHIAEIFIVYIVSGLFIWLSLSSYNFRIGFITYKIAFLSYILPLFVILAYVFMTEGNNLKSIYQKKINIIHTLLIILVLYIYISRSGNLTIIPASTFELNFRKMLENTLPVRPRLKEFLIGYPCLFLLFKTDNNNNRFFIYVLLGSAITGISILNTFCHGFTPVNTSLLRAFWGVVLGSITSPILYALYSTFKKYCFNQYLNK